MNLEMTRQEIDQLNAELVALLEKRMVLVDQVVAFKQASDQPVLDAKREDYILQKVAEQVQNKQYQEAIQATFADILQQSRAYQSKRLKK